MQQFTPITGTGSRAFDEAYDWGRKDSKVRQEVGVDSAVRAGVGEMMERGGSASYQAPMGQPWAGSAYQPPGMAAAPAQAAPGASAAPAAPLTPAPQPEGPGARLRMGTLRVEDPTGRAVNPWGFSGFYQFGTGALKDAGAYEPSQGEDLKRNQWTGTVVLPSGKRLSHAEFNADTEAQREAWDMHQARLGTEIDRRGLNRFIGQTVGGIPITEDSIRAMMHIGGAHGAQLFLTTGGAYNPADANGTTLSAYAQKVLGGGGSPAAGAAPGGAAPSVASMGLFPAGGADPSAGGAPAGSFNARMDPILSRLAQTPGGGATALSILNQQSRYDMAQGKRSDAYQRLAMQALGQGNAQVFQYYARLGGLNIPPEVVQNAGLSKRLATASLTAERIYSGDPQQASAFVQRYLQTGDVQSAFQAAGPPRSNPRISIQQVYDEHEGIVRFFGVQTAGPNAGAAAPVAGADGQPLTGSPRPFAPPAPRVIQGPNGPVVVSPATAEARPVRGLDGQPVGPPPARPAATPQPRVIQTDRGPMMLRPDGVAVPIATEDGGAVAAPAPRPAAQPRPTVLQTPDGPVVLGPGGTASPVTLPDGGRVPAPPQRPTPQARQQIIQTDNGPMVLQPDGSAIPVTDPDGGRVGAVTPRPQASRVIQGPDGPVVVNPQDASARPVTGADGAPVGPPPQRPAAPRNLQVIQTSEGPMVLQPDGTATPIPGADGAPVRPNLANVRQPDRVVRLQMLKAAGFDEATANAIAAGATPPPSAIVSALTRVQKMVQDDFAIPADKKAGEVEGRMTAMFGADWNSRMRGTPGAAAAPTAEADIPTLTPEQARAAAPGTRFRTLDGRVMRVPAAR